MQDKKNKRAIVNSGFITNLPLFQFLPPDIIHKLALSVEPLVFSPFEYILLQG